MKKGLRGLAKLYAGILVVLGLYAWYIDVTLFHSGREHLLPDILLCFATLPSSLGLTILFEGWPDFFTRPFVQLISLTICGGVQAGLLFFLSRPNHDEL